MKVKILPEDKLCSQYIRSRDRRCVRCGSPVRFNDEGLPISHSASHYITRGNWAVRFYPPNIDTLCFPCHRLFGGDLREDYKKFKVSQLGQKGFNALIRKSNERVSKLKVRAWAKEHFKKLLKN